MGPVLHAGVNGDNRNRTRVQTALQARNIQQGPGQVHREGEGQHLGVAQVHVKQKAVPPGRGNHHGAKETAVRRTEPPRKHTSTTATYACDPGSFLRMVGWSTASTLIISGKPPLGLPNC